MKNTPAKPTMTRTTQNVFVSSAKETQMISIMQPSIAELANSYPPSEFSYIFSSF